MHGGLVESPGQFRIQQVEHLKELAPVQLFWVSLFMWHYTIINAARRSSCRTQHKSLDQCAFCAYIYSMKVRFQPHSLVVSAEHVYTWMHSLCAYVLSLKDSFYLLNRGEQVEGNL